MILGTAFHSVRAQRQRALLSAVGIAVGTLAIILLISVAQGAKREVEGQVDSLGVNLLIVVPFRIPEDGSIPMNPNVAGLSYLKAKDAASVRRAPGVRVAVPWVFPGGLLKAGARESASTLIVATVPAWFTMRRFDFIEGGPLEDEHSLKRVVVLGEVAKNRLFGAGPAIGRLVTVSNEAYEVVGVTRESGKSGLLSALSLDNVAWIPFGYIDRKLGDPPLSRILIQTNPEADPKDVIARVEATLAKRLSKESFSVITQRDLLKLIFTVMNIFASLLLGLTSIALLVGGVGIMTVMLMSVGERAKEIGIRKAVGATNGDIFVQFLTEAVILALAGGLVGLLLSYVACLVLASSTSVTPVMSLGTVGLGLGVSLFVGSIFGLAPAMKAARQDPVSSLRND